MWFLLTITAIAHQIMDPFGLETNDLPMHKYCADMIKEARILLRETSQITENEQIEEIRKSLRVTSRLTENKQTKELGDSLLVREPFKTIENNVMSSPSKAQSDTSLFQVELECNSL